VVDEEKYISKYDKKYFEDLDKLVLEEMKKEPEDRTIEFISLTSDNMFKTVMRQNSDIFKDFLIKTMNIDINEEEDNVLYFLDKELIKVSIKEKGKTMDFNVSIGKGLVICVEVNKSKYSAVKIRNDFYFERLDMMQVEVGDNYNDIKNKDLYQLNLNCNLEEEKISKRILVEYDILNNVEYDNRKRKFIINLVNYKNMYYTNPDKMKKEEIFMAGLMSNSFTELYSIMSQILSPIELDNFMESVVNMCKDMESIHEWQKEKLDAIVKENEMEEARASGLEQGISQGREQTIITTIKNMLINNADYEFISKVTNKSIEEIKNIEKKISE